MHWAITNSFHDYLICHEFHVLRDSNILSKVMTNNRSAADMRKLADLSAYLFPIIYRKSKNNKNVDALSRYHVESEYEMMG